METIKPGKFVLPPDYNPEDISSELFVEDIDDDDVELWFMQMPSDVDLESLQKQVVNLKGITQLQDESLSQAVECLATPYGPDQISPYNLIVPRRSDGKLSVVNKKFSGHFLLSKSIGMPESELPEFSLKARRESSAPGLSNNINSAIVKKENSVKGKKKVTFDALLQEGDDHATQPGTGALETRQADSSNVEEVQDPMCTESLSVKTEFDESELAQNIELCMETLAAIKGEPYFLNIDLGSKNKTKKAKKSKKNKLSELQPDEEKNKKPSDAF